MLLDRERERQELDQLLVLVREGLSGALVLRGEAGIGKTALLEHAIASASDMQAAHVVGVESEMELGFAGLHQLLIPFLAGFEQLPEPQREALGCAFGLIQGAEADPFLVGLAALTMLADAAAEQPVLCVVDDAQWLDEASAKALGFIARRLLADRIGMLFAEREPAGPRAAFEGLQVLRVGPLPEAAARELLFAVAGTSLERRTGERILAEARGNPLALVELGGGLTAAQLSGSSPLPERLPLGRKLEERFLSTVRTLPAETQTLLLLASAQQVGDPEHLWRAAESLGIGPDAAEAPALDRLITFEPRVAFRHPLVRSALYQGASARERREAHRALAGAVDPGVDADRRAWHLAVADVRPDEQIASELERSADRARRRGGWASGAAFLQRSAELTPDPHRRARRALAAARAMLMAGAPRRARALLEQAAPRLVDPLARAQAARLEGEIHFGTGQPAEAAAILLGAARAFMPLDPGLARHTLLEALEAASYAGRFGSPRSVRDIVEVARELAPASQPGVADLFLEGFAARVEGRSGEAAALLRQAITRLRAAEELRWYGLGCLAAGELLDHEERRTLTVRWVTLARDQGALASLELALMFLVDVEVRAGRLRSAEAIQAEAAEISAETDTPGMPGKALSPELLTLAWRGRESEFRSAAAGVMREVSERGIGAGVGYVNATLCLLELSLGNYEAALRCVLDVYEEDRFHRGTQVLPDLVEAGVRGGDREAARQALDRLSERALASGAPWALGLLARSRALLAEDARAEGFYREAIVQLERCEVAPDLARAHLLLGEWQRRRRRRRDAREELRIAHEMFDSMEAVAFAERARLELLATGEHVRQRTVTTRDELTPQEERIARLASEGASNQEIAVHLFISSSTVAYHLRKVFQKLGVRSRTQLDRALQSSDAHSTLES